MHRSIRRLSSVFVSCLALGGALVAQGSDNCAAPQVIGGTGSFPFNSTAATTGAQGQGEALCNFFGSTAIDNDVWFTWTAPSTGFAYLSMCAGTSSAFDTKVAVYPGTACPAGGSSLACNDDACNFISELGFNCTAGSSYVLQIGAFPGSGGASTAGAASSSAPPSGSSRSAAPNTARTARSSRLGDSFFALLRFSSVCRGARVSRGHRP